MATTTPVFGWPIPQGSDLIAQIASIVAGAVTAIENQAVVSSDSKSVADGVASYPVGVSVMALGTTGSTSGAWPSPGTSAVVLTVRRSGGYSAVQVWARSTANVVKIRTGWVDGGWSDWSPVAGPGTPQSTASGTYTFTNTNQAQTVTVAFPSGRFTAAPTVVTSGHDRRQVLAVQGVSSTGFTLALGSVEFNGGNMPVQQNWYADWIAMQN